VMTGRTWPSLYRQFEQGESWPGLHRPSGQGIFVRTDTNDGERTRLGRPDLHMLSERGGFMQTRH